LNLPDPPRTTRPSKHYRHCLIGAQALAAILAIAAFTASFLVHQGWMWAGFPLVIMIPLVAASVREQFTSQQKILRHWHLVPAEVTKVQNSGGESNQVTLYLSYQWNGRVHEATKTVKDNTPVDIKLPQLLLVNPEKGKEYRILEEITLVEVESSSLSKPANLSNAADSIENEPT